MTDVAAQNLQKLYKDLGDTQTDVRNRNMYQLLLTLLNGKTLLDIGAGALHFLHHAKEKGYDVEGVEPDRELVKLGEQFYGKVGKIYSLPIEKLDEIENKYDSITMIDVLEHIEDDDAALKRIKNRLDTKGKLIILVPAWQFLYSDRDKSIGHYRRYNAPHLQRVLEGAGYEVESIRYWNMLGFFTYFTFEKVLKKRAPHGMRTKKKGLVSSTLHSLIHFWVKNVENNCNPGFGLSVIAVAHKKVV